MRPFNPDSRQPSPARVERDLSLPTDCASLPCRSVRLYGSPGWWPVAAAAHDLQHVRQNETDSGAILVPVRFGAAVLA